MSRWIFLFFMAAFVVACDTSSNIKPPNHAYFLKYLGGEGNQTAVDMIINADGTFYVLGNSRAAQDSIQKIYLAKVSALGEVVWQTTLGGAEMEARDFLLTKDGNYLVVTGNSGGNIFLFRLTLTSTGLASGKDSTGYTGAYANTVTEFSDQSLLVEGYTATTPLQELHFRWATTPWGPYTTGSWLVNSSPPAAEATADFVGVRTWEHTPTQFYTFGYTNASYPGSNNNNLKFWMYNLNQYGSVGSLGGGNDDNGMFDKEGYASNKTLTCAIPAAAGGYIVAGVSTTGPAAMLKVAITKSANQDVDISPSGVFQDTLLLSLGSPPATGPTPYVTASSSLQSNLLLANKYNAATTPTSNIALIKVNYALQPLWGGGLLPIYVEFGGDGDDTAAAVGELPDGHIMVLGTMQLGNPPEQFKIVLMKLNSSGGLAE